MLNTFERERGRLFVRPTEPRPLRINSRHIALLANIARFGLATTAQLAALDGGSEQNVSRELLALWENEYVERPIGQVTSRRLFTGSLPTVYGLSRKGARILRQHGYEVRRRVVDAIDKTQDAGWRFIEHKVLITGFMTDLELALRSRPELGLLQRRDILADAPKTRRDRRARLTARVAIDGVTHAHSVDPDELFGLRFLDTEEESYFAFECDRGFMPVRRFSKTRRQTYYVLKMMVYHAANRQGIHTRDLGLPSFRVATLTTTPSRVAEMIDAVHEMTGGKGSNMFLFIDQETLARSNPLDVGWLTGKGEKIRLTD